MDFFDLITKASPKFYEFKILSLPYFKIFRRPCDRSSPGYSGLVPPVSKFKIGAKKHSFCLFLGKLLHTILPDERERKGRQICQK